MLRASLTSICIRKLALLPPLSLSPSLPLSHPYSRRPPSSPSSAQTRVVLQKDPPPSLSDESACLSPLFSQGQSNGGGAASGRPPMLLSLPSCCPSIQSLPSSSSSSSSSLPIAFCEIYTRRRRHFVPLLTRRCTVLYLPSPLKVCYENEKLSTHLLYYTQYSMFCP